MLYTAIVRPQITNFSIRHKHTPTIAVITTTHTQITKKMVKSNMDLRTKQRDINFNNNGDKKGLKTLGACVFICVAKTCFVDGFVCVFFADIRKEEVMAIRNRFPNKVPVSATILFRFNSGLLSRFFLQVIVQRFSKETSLPHLDKTKFLVPQEITMSQFHTIIR